jgi:signal transduction histidine kinase
MAEIYFAKDGGKILMVGLLDSLLNTAFFMFPGLAIILVTFKDRYRVKHIPLAVALFFLTEAALQYGLFTVFDLPLPARFAGGLLNLLSTFVIVKCDISKTFFVFLTAMAYTTFLQNLIDILLLMININRNLLNLLLLAITFPAVVLFSARILRKIINIEGSSAWVIIWVLPGIIAIEGLAVFNFGWLLELSPPVLLMLLFVFVGTFVLGLSIIPRFLTQTAEQTRLTLEVERAATQMEIEREQYLRISENVEFTRRAKHDLRHHLAVIEAFADDTEKIRSYIKELNDSMGSLVELHYCENQAVNAVIAHYLSHVKNAEIKTNIVIPEHTGNITASDLCVLVGNIVENAAAAVAAAGNNHFINIVSEVRSGFLSFSAENSFAGELKTDRNGGFLSAKTGRAGVGLSSVRTICERYGGFVEVTARDGVFRVSCILSM